MRSKRYILALATACVIAAGWLTGCGGNGSAVSSSPAVPSTSRVRLYQHGDEFVYNVTGFAYYNNQRYQVTGDIIDRLTSVGGGVFRLHREWRLTLRRGSERRDDNRETVWYFVQNRDTREVTLLAYASEPDAPRINSRIPYKVCVPGLVNAHSNFSFSTQFEDGAQMMAAWQIGGIEPVPTYAGEYHCYRVRLESELQHPAPFRETTSTGLCWFSPQLGIVTRAELQMSTFLGDLPIEYQLTLLLYRTNVSLQSSQP